MSISEHLRYRNNICRCRMSDIADIEIDVDAHLCPLAKQLGLQQHILQQGCYKAAYPAAVSATEACPTVACPTVTCPTAACFTTACPSAGFPTTACLSTAGLTAADLTLH
jgi:hypothetical protein